MPIFDGVTPLITHDDPTAGVLNVSVQQNLYSAWKVWVTGKITFDTELDVNGTTERITIANHGQNTGNSIQYFKDGGTEAIGLTDTTKYWVRNIDDDTIEVYDTKANAEAGPATTGRQDLTASGVGNGETHRFFSDTQKYLPAFRTTGGDPLTPGVEAGAYFFLQNQAGSDWRIISSDEDQTINYSGNLVGEDSAVTLINVTPGRSVLHLGLQPVTQRVDEILNQQQLQAYNGVVSIDTSGGGTTGTVFPIGTDSVPVNNLADALTIATDNNFSRFRIRGSVTLTAATGNSIWEGFGGQSSLDLGGQDVSGTEFMNLRISGTQVTPSSLVRFDDCNFVGPVTNFTGIASNCLFGSMITLATGNIGLYSCQSEVAGGVSPILDLNGQTGLDVVIRNYNGGLQLNNGTQSDTVMSIGLNTGKVTFDATFTAASDVQVRGVGTVVNNGSVPDGDGATIDTTGLLSKNGIALRVWDELLSLHATSGSAGETLRTLEKIFTNDAIVAFNGGTGENEVTIYDDDGITVLRKMSVTTDGLTRTVLVGS